MGSGRRWPRAAARALRSACFCSRAALLARLCCARCLLRSSLQARMHEHKCVQLRVRRWAGGRVGMGVHVCARQCTCLCTCVQMNACAHVRMHVVKTACVATLHVCPLQ